MILFHVLDPQEIAPKFREPVLLVDMEDSADALEVSPEYARNEYRQKIDAHIEALSTKTRGAGMDYFLMDTARPLDEGLREYLAVRQGEILDGLSGALVSGRRGGGGAARLAAPAAEAQDHAAAVQLADVLRAARRRAPSSTGGCATCCCSRCARR